VPRLIGDPLVDERVHGIAAAHAAELGHHRRRVEDRGERRLVGLGAGPQPEARRLDHAPISRAACAAW